MKKRTRRSRSQHENELLGLALLALGLVLAAILYLGLDGGAVGSWLAGVLTEIIGNAAYVLPVALVALGGLLLARSDLLEVRPFRLGVGVSFLGLMTLLGKDSGGFIGLAIGGTLAALIGQTGAAIIGGRSACRGPPARDGRFHGSDPASHGSRDEAGGDRSSPRVRVAVERVADRRGRPHPRACARRAPATSCWTERSPTRTSSAQARTRRKHRSLSPKSPS